MPGKARWEGCVTTLIDPTMPRRRLGRKLRELRNAAGLLAEPVAVELDCSTAKISTIEGGKNKVRKIDVERMLAFYANHKPGLITPEITDELLDLTRQSGQKAWWWPYQAGVQDWFRELIGLEGESSLVRNFEYHAIPGLLQTEAYASALTASSLHVPESQRAEVVAVRVGRQANLRRGDFKLWVVIAEHVLHRQVADDPAILRDQLEHLAAMAKLPNVRIQILPTKNSLQHWLTNPFMLLEFPPDVWTKTVYWEHPGGAEYLQDPAGVARYELAWSALTNPDKAANAAHDEQSSLQVIQAA
ncbi:XRE family transcriptional regulator [Pseudonocardiaceae bacterium YIM PH 21723]|nr:XRE family transcriptional regulator [Pseudonocardiaceae bacterium YIM PH 21723]